MTLSYSEDPTTRTVELILKGRITREEFDEIIAPLQTFIDTHGSIRVVEVIEDLDGFDASVIPAGLRFDLKNLRHVSHVAVVSDLGWISPLSKAAGALSSTKLRTFGLSEIEAARSWIKMADPDV